MNEAVLEWLRARGAESIPHAGGSLHEHLGRVAERLSGHGASEAECLAALNELDVCERSPEIAAKAGDYFRSVFPTWGPITSPAVMADAARVLGL